MTTSYTQSQVQKKQTKLFVESPSDECCTSHNKHSPTSNHGAITEHRVTGRARLFSVDLTNMSLPLYPSACPSTVGGQSGTKALSLHPILVVLQCWVGLSAELDHIRIQIHPCLPRSTFLHWFSGWRSHLLSLWVPEKTHWGTAGAF